MAISDKELYNIGYRTGKQEAKSTLAASLARGQWLAEYIAAKAFRQDYKDTAGYSSKPWKPKHDPAHWLKQAQEAVE